MTVTATLAGAISMLANFAFFFGGWPQRNPLGLVGVLLVTLLAPIAAMLVQTASAGRANSKPTARAPKFPAGLCGWPPRCNISTARRGSTIRSRRQPRDGAYVHHRSAAWRLLGTLREPSLHRGTRRATEGDGAELGPRPNPDPGLERRLQGARAGGAGHSLRCLAQAPSARCGHGHCSCARRPSLARRGLCARHFARDLAPPRPARRADQDVRRQAARDASLRPHDRNPARGCVRIAVPRCSTPCRCRWRQPSGRGRQQGGAFQAADQRNTPAYLA